MEIHHLCNQEDYEGAEHVSQMEEQDTCAEFE